MKEYYLNFIAYAIDLIGKCGIDIPYEEVRRRYSEPHRHFHTIEHLNDVLEQIISKRQDLSVEDFVSLIIAAVFHDIVYDPQRKDNEEKSAELLEWWSYTLDESEYYEIKENARKIILATKTHDKIHDLISSFNKIDCSILDRDYPELLKWEEQIFEEYKFAGKEYKQRRIQFLKLSIPDHIKNSENLNKLIQHVETY